MSNDIEHLYMRLFMPSMCGQPISRPVRCGAKWESGVKMQIPESREEAVEEVRSVRHEVQVYSDGSGIGSGIGAAVVLLRNGEEKCTLRKYLGKEGEHTVFEAEVMGLALAAELVRAETHMDAAEIGTDSQAALRATRNTRGHRDSTCWTSTKRDWRRQSVSTERTLSRSGGPQGTTAL